MRRPVSAFLNPLKRSARTIYQPGLQKLEKDVSFPQAHPSGDDSSVLFSPGIILKPEWLCPAVSLSQSVWYLAAKQKDVAETDRNKNFSPKSDPKTWSKEKDRMCSDSRSGVGIIIHSFFHLFIIASPFLLSISPLPPYLPHSNTHTEISSES